MAEGQKYLIRDPQGNVYGPADAVLLREWVAQGRIVPGMAIAPRETREWVEASVHPETARAIAARLAELQAATGAPPGVGQPAEVNEGPSGPETFSGITTGEESPNAREQPAGQIQPVQVEMVSASEILPGEGVDLESRLVPRVEDHR